MNQQFLTELKAVTAENRIFTDEPMKKHTTFRVGGPADILVQSCFAVYSAKIQAASLAMRPLFGSNLPQTENISDGKQ